MDSVSPSSEVAAFGGRIDHLDERLTGGVTRLEQTVHRLAEDVAVLRATH
jgi:hypothetical protein